jgi:hypothetical protein
MIYALVDERYDFTTDPRFIAASCIAVPQPLLLLAQLWRPTQATEREPFRTSLGRHIVSVER